MRRKTARQFVVLGIVGVLVTLTPASNVQADQVALGWDLWLTDSACLNMDPIGLGLQPFEGVPIGPYDFGGGIGVQDTVNTDTIIRRLDVADVPSPPGTAPTIDIELVALQLVSVNPLDLDGPGGFPADFIYATLQTGNPSLGTMNISFDPLAPPPIMGTFVSSLFVNFDLHYGALNGPIVFSDTKNLSLITPEDWERGPLSNLLVVELDNVNRYHAGPGNRSQDFWAKKGLHENPDGSYHSVIQPEPTTIALLAFCGLMLGRRRRRTC